MRKNEELEKGCGGREFTFWAIDGPFAGHNICDDL
jgi:hypothetical protein